MIKSFILSNRLRITYRVNSFIYSIRQFPIIKKILPNRLYKSKVLKILGMIFSILIEILQIFLGKFLYLWLMIFSFLSMSQTKMTDTFLHMFFFLTLPWLQYRRYQID